MTCVGFCIVYGCCYACFCSNMVLIDDNTCSVDKVLPCINITYCYYYYYCVGSNMFFTPF